MRILCLSLFSLSAFAQQIGVIAHGTCQGSGAGTCVATLGTTTGATLIVASVASTGATNSCAVTMTDSQSNTWNALTDQASTTVTNCIQYAYSKAGAALSTASSGHTVSFSAGGNYTALAVVAYSNTPGGATNPYDSVQNGANTGAGAAASLGTGNITPSQSCDLIFSGGGLRSANTYTASPLTVVDTAPWASGSAIGVGSSYEIQQSAAAISNTWTMGGSGQIAVTIAAFKATSTTACITAKPPRRRVISMDILLRNTFSALYDPAQALQ